MSTSSSGAYPVPVSVTVPPGVTCEGEAVSSATMSCALIVDDASSRSTAPFVVTFGSSVTLSARTVKLSGPRSPTAGCSLIVIAATFDSTGSRASSSRVVTSGVNVDISVGCRLPRTTSMIGCNTPPISLTNPVSRFVMGCNTSPRGMPTTLICETSTTGSSCPSWPRKPPSVPVIVTGASTSGSRRETAAWMSTVSSRS